MSATLKFFAVSASLLGVACAQSAADEAAPAVEAPPPALEDVFDGVFLIGAALNRAQFTEADARAAPLVRTHFNTITPENILKWQSVHPEPERYDFEGPDRFVEFGEQNGMHIVGHTLVWHNQTPAWVFEDAEGNPLSRDALLERMRDHIQMVVGRYRGRIDGWDVVNEAVNEDGSLRETPWLRIIGEDYLVKAYEFAHEADPEAELYYNDFALENAPKRAGAVRLVQQLLAQGIPIAAVGLQGHNRLDWPSVEQQDATIAAFAALGVKVLITELDIDVLPPATDHRGADVRSDPALQERLDPYADGLPDSVQQALAERYAELFDVYLRHSDVITRVTFWGVTDGDSWLNYWPVSGRTNHPLLFDRDGRPKPAFDAVVRTAEQHLAPDP